jgi:hypothetical protein
MHIKERLWFGENKNVPKLVGMAHEFVICRESLLHPVSKPPDIPFATRTRKF